MSDIEIARSCVKKNIKDICYKVGLDDDLFEVYGDFKAKVKYNDILNSKNGKLILVTAISPTPFGEGKTTVSIGLLDGLCSLKKDAIGVLREPSLGPVFGMKGGAAGGGYSQVVPMEDINLHFTGDFHAITAANNLIAAAIDNHIYQGNKLGINENMILFKRCLDVNDRALRDRFNITAASEVMSIFCLANDLSDLRERLANIIVAYNIDNVPVYVRDLNLEGSLVVLLKDALNPNMVQTLENNPVLVHGGPFANIAHGCNSVIATKLGIKLANYVVTEAGFGSDLGAEKFFDIKCRKTNLKPDCVVLVATIKSLKYNGGVSKEDIMKPSVDAVRRGLPNLNVHIENMLKFNSNLIVCLNKYDTDTLEEIDVVRQCCNCYDIPFTMCDSYSKGGIGAVVLAKEVCDMCEKENEFKLLYDDFISVEEKIEKLCREIYHAGNVVYSDLAKMRLDEIKRLELSHLPVCISKTQYSISDDPKKLGFPTGHEMFVRDIELYNGAGFITILMGTTIKMPGLPKEPNYEKIYLDDENEIVGLS